MWGNSETDNCGRTTDTGLFKILDESEEKLFFTAYERYKKELRK